MTVSTIINRLDYTGDGVSISFSFPYRFIATADIKVAINGVSLISGFTVTGVPIYTGGGGFSGATVLITPAPAVSAIVTLYNQPDLLQATALRANDPLPSTAIEAMVDKVTLGLQYIYSKLTRTLAFPDTDPASAIGALPIYSARAGKYLGFDGAGNPVAISGASTGTDLSTYVSTTTGTTTSRSMASRFGDLVSVKDFGAKGDNSTNDTGPLILAIASGLPLYWPAGTYLITGQLSTSTQQKPCWIGEGEFNTIIKYVGGPTNIDIITVGDGTTPINNVEMHGFTIQSSINMTAGYALRLRKIYESKITVSVQGRSGQTALGNNFYNGIYFNLADGVRFYGQTVVAKNDAVSVNGGLGGTGYKSDLYIYDCRIQGATVGIRVGGAFGGLYLINPSLTTNVNHILFDQTLTAETNREIFMTQVISDVTTGGGSGIKFAGADTSLILMDGCWCSSSSGIGVEVTAAFAGKIKMTGCRVFNNVGDGVRVSTSTGEVDIVGGGIHNNGAWGINPAIASHRVAYASVYMAGNTSGNINPANAPGATVTLYGNFASQVNLELIDLYNSGSQIQITNTGANGAGIKFTGNGGTTPNKSIRVNGGVMQWLNSAFSTVIFTLGDTGQVTMKDKLFPATDGIATQNVCGLYANTGAPNNANGANGDIYFRADGGAGTTIYQKRAGAWVGFV